MKQIFIDAIPTITPERWNNCNCPVIEKSGEKMWKIDHLTENQVKPLIITFSDDVSDTNEAESHGI